MPRSSICTLLAFSLVELSIVLVMLGLLVGGVLSGQSLIRASELRGISVDQAKWVTATQTFRDKYFALPGDMGNAQSFWGVAHATPATCAVTASTTGLTCNGNADGKIDISTGANEPFRYWQQLANAGLIEGVYSGIKSGLSAEGTDATNAPRGKISNSYWYAAYVQDYTSSSGAFDGYFDTNYENTLRFGRLNAGYSPGILLKPEEAWSIDTKMDDGKPAQGKLLTRSANQFYGDACTDAAGGAPGSANLAANYNLTRTAVSCGLVFRQQF